MTMTLTAACAADSNTLTCASKRDTAVARGWAESDRRARLPVNWGNEIRPRILARDGHRCRWIDRGRRCTRQATDVDHIVNNDDDSDANLQALCVTHHRKKSAAEGHRAKARLAALRYRPPQPHPGLKQM
jgi:5-methylcytosine-specific restriction protein A